MYLYTNTYILICTSISLTIYCDQDRNRNSSYEKYVIAKNVYF